MIGRFRRRLAAMALAAVVPLIVLALAVALLARDVAPVRSARLAVFDTWQRLAPRAYADVAVRVVDIDAETVRRYGDWPWPRVRLAQLVERVHTAGAGTVVLTVPVDRPDRAAPQALVPEWSGVPAFERLRFLIQDMPDPDILMAQAVARARGVVGMELAREAAAEEPLPDNPRWSMVAIGAPPLPFLPQIDGVRPPLPAIDLAAAGLGVMTPMPDPDDVVRHMPMLLAAGERIVPTLAAEAVRVGQGAGTYVTRARRGGIGPWFSGGVTDLRIGGLSVRTDDRARLRLHYAAEATRRTLPAWQLLVRDDGPAIADAGLEGAIILIGASAAGPETGWRTPLGGGMSTAALWAETLEQMLLGNPLVRPGWARVAEIGAAALGGLAVAGLLAAFGGAAALGTATAAVGVLAAGAWGLFRVGGLLVDPVGPSAVVLATLVAGAIVQTVRAERQRAAIRGAFGHYLAPELVDELAADPGEVHLGGRIRPVTVMFTDIRGFTGLAERLPPDRLSRLLSDYFTPMTEVVLAARGTVDKFIGDGLMAFWGAPIADTGHAAHACRAALAMMARLDALNVEWRREAEAAAAADGRPPDHEPLTIGIGLNSGDCLVGNMGSRQRFNYTAMGDPVNLAAQLEELSKTYRVGILVGEATRAAAPDFAFLELDRIRIEGRQETVAVHALLGDEATARDPMFRTLAAAHADLREAEAAGDRAAAEAALARAGMLAPPGVEALYAYWRERLAQRSAAPAVVAHAPAARQG